MVRGELREDDVDLELVPQIQQPFLIRSRASSENQRKEDIKEVLRVFEAIKFDGRFEINSEYNILMRGTYLLSKKIENVFGGRLEVLPVTFLDEKNIQ